MINIEENVVLAPCTTFFIGGPASFFVEVLNADDLIEALNWANEHKQEVFVLGGGSNVLISDEGFPGLVIKVKPMGLKIILENAETAELEIASGEVWDEVVGFTADKNLWGVENLSHIPGLAGAIVVQNGGAYGQEIGNVLKHVTVLNRINNQVEQIAAADCGLTYRYSIFNTNKKNAYVILSINIILSKIPKPNLEYGDVKQYFTEKNIANPTLQEMRNAIVEIRNKKFPFPDIPTRGNSGSFFRGKILSDAEFAGMKTLVARKFGLQASERLKNMENRLKVPQGFKTPTAFLLELSGVKGLSMGGAIVNKAQPAIVVNSTGHATANDVLQLATEVFSIVKDKTGIDLEIEPELIGFSRNV